MKTYIFIIALCLISSPIVAELTQEDLEAIRSFVKEEVTEEVAELEIRINLRLDAVDQRFDAVDRRIDDTNKRIDDMGKRLDSMNNMIVGMFGTIAIMVILATALTYAATRLSRTYNKMQDYIEIIRKNTETVESAHKTLKESREIEIQNGKMLEALVGHASAESSAD